MYTHTRSTTQLSNSMAQECYTLLLPLSLFIFYHSGCITFIFGCTRRKGCWTAALLGLGACVDGRGKLCHLFKICLPSVTYTVRAFPCGKLCFKVSFGINAANFSANVCTSCMIEVTWSAIRRGKKTTFVILIRYPEALDIKPKIKD